MRIIKHNIIWAAFILFTLFSGCGNTTKQVNRVTFSTDITNDATFNVLRGVQAIGDAEKTIISFQKGVYHFYPDKGFETFNHISNHDDVLARTAFPLQACKNVEIDGQGSTFIFHGRMIPFLLENSENITIKNLAIDWEQPFHSEMKVVATNKKNKTIDFEIPNDYPYEIRNGQLWFIKEYYQHEIGQCIYFDPSKKEIAFDGNKFALSTIKKGTIQNGVDAIKTKYPADYVTPHIFKPGTEYKLRFEQLKPGLVRAHGHNKKMPPAGVVLVAKGTRGENRLAPAFRVTHVNQLFVNTVTVHHANGMGLIAENSKDITLDGFHVKPSGNRNLSTTADATHFVGCRGKIELKNCTMHNQMDDALNVHGTYQEVSDVLASNQLGIRIGHPQQQNFSIGLPNDTIGVVRLSDSFTPYHKLTLKSIEKINGRYQILTFNQSLPKGIAKGDLLENLSAYPELLVQNCHMSGNRARGLLLSTPRKTVIDNNYFHTQMDAILMPVESSSWYESGSVNNLTIINNMFEDCNHGGLDRGVIRFVTDEENDYVAFRNITISNNTFNHFDNMILEVSNTNNLVFKENLIKHSGNYPMLFPDNPAIKVQHSKNLIFENNEYKAKAKVILVTDDQVTRLKFN